MAPEIEIDPSELLVGTLILDAGQIVTSCDAAFRHQAPSATGSWPSPRSSSLRTPLTAS